MCKAAKISLKDALRFFTLFVFITFYTWLNLNAKCCSGVAAFLQHVIYFIYTQVVEKRENSMAYFMQFCSWLQ